MTKNTDEEVHGGPVGSWAQELLCLWCWNAPPSWHMDVFINTEAHQCHLIRTKRRSYHPGNSKGLRNGVSGTRVRPNTKTKNASGTPITSEMTKCFRSSGWGTGSRTQYIFFLLFHGNTVYIFLLFQDQKAILILRLNHFQSALSHWNANLSCPVPFLKSFSGSLYITS